MIVGRTQLAHSACGAKPALRNARPRRTTLALAVRRWTRPACPTRTNMSLGCNAVPGVLFPHDSCNIVMLLLEQVGVYARAVPRLYGSVSRGMAAPGAYQVFSFLFSLPKFYQIRLGGKCLQCANHIHWHVNHIFSLLVIQAKHHVARAL